MDLWGVSNDGLRSGGLVEEKRYVWELGSFKVGKDDLVGESNSCAEPRELELQYVLLHRHMSCTHVCDQQKYYTWED